MTALLIQADPRFPGVWDKVKPYLERAIERSGCKDWLIEDVYQMAAAQQVQLWAIVEGEDVSGAGVTRLAHYPRRRVLDVLLLGSDPQNEEGWLATLPQLKQIARAAGAAAIHGTGRAGWARKLQATPRPAWEIDITDEESDHGR